MPWNAGVYLKFGAQRIRPCVELVERIFLRADPKRIVDLGCGPGNSTDVLIRRWPTSSVVGLDNSEPMLERARRDKIQATFGLADISTWKADEPFDVVFSNAAFQWVEDHARVFPSLLDSVAPGGVLAVQMPRNFMAPSHVLLRQVARSGPWADAVKECIREEPVAEPHTYYDYLRNASEIDIWETEYLQVLEGEDAVLNWCRGTALVPYLQALGAGTPLAEQFESEYAKRLREAYPRRSDGKTLFAFKRIFIVATK
eukprot:TRINITY_DN5805_c0_g1_i1.p1 TRINITY_DN5805_c0_g1~~TRINITY_DN5805_c0_g1_i1.p1  ORF type:complete len:257 (+),score=20.04 TRINITY_DN5805_c0_g1_i1:18-788(+)